MRKLMGSFLLAGSARDAWSGSDRRMVPLRFLHPRQDSGRREGVADVLVDGGTREDDADDLPSRSEQRTPRIARLHVGIEGVDAPRDRPAVVDVLADGGDLFGHAGGADGQATVLGITEDGCLCAS